MTSISDTQLDMRNAYLFGVPGIICSGTVWIAAGLVSLIVSPVAGILTLIFGGTLIFPLSVALCKVFGRSGKHQKDNPLAPLALEGTVWMLLSIPVAVGASFHKLEWFFPAMLVVIAGRYLTFSTLYGLRVFWAFGGTLAIAAVVLAMLNAPIYVGGITGGLIEMAFALLIYQGSKPARNSKPLAT